MAEFGVFHHGFAFGLALLEGLEALDEDFEVGATAWGGGVGGDGFGEAAELGVALELGFDGVAVDVDQPLLHWCVEGCIDRLEGFQYLRVLLLAVAVGGRFVHVLQQLVGQAGRGELDGLFSLCHSAESQQYGE